MTFTAKVSRSANAGKRVRFLYVAAKNVATSLKVRVHDLRP